MYGSSKRILALLAVLFTTEITMMGVIFGVPKAGEVGQNRNCIIFYRGPNLNYFFIGTNNPAPGLLLCADADPPHMHWIAFYWTATLIIESFLLCLALRKAYANVRTGAGGSLMRVLTRDSVLYFFFIFWIYAGNQVLWLRNDITMNELGTGFSFCISAMLANRLMVEVRTRYYRPLEHGTGASDVVSGVVMAGSDGKGRVGSWSVAGSGPHLGFRRPGTMYTTTGTGMLSTMCTTMDISGGSSSAFYNSESDGTTVAITDVDASKSFASAEKLESGVEPVVPISLPLSTTNSLPLPLPLSLRLAAGGPDAEPVVVREEADPLGGAGRVTTTVRYDGPVGRSVSPAREEIEMDTFEETTYEERRGF